MVAVVRIGVTPLPHTMLGVTVPDICIAAAPPPGRPTQKKEAVPEPPVPAGKETLAWGEQELPVTVMPPAPEARLVEARA